MQGSGRLVDPLASSKLKVKAAPGKRRSFAPSAPELKVGYKAAGRETMAAIEQELATPSLSAAEAPLIEISEAPAGRETMAAIEHELSREMRPRQNTLPYADRIPNAPGARLPSKRPAAKSKPPQHADVPELTATAPPPVALPAPLATPDALEIFELLTFIVRGSEIGDLSTDALRRRFVERNLLHRIPGGAIDAVERVEVTPWTAKGTMVVRIWSRQASSAVSR